MTENPLGQGKVSFEKGKKVNNDFYFSFKVQGLVVIRTGLKINLSVAYSFRLPTVINFHSLNPVAIPSTFPHIFPSPLLILSSHHPHSVPQLPLTSDTVKLEPELCGDQTTTQARLWKYFEDQFCKYSWLSSNSPYTIQEG